MAQAGIGVGMLRIARMERMKTRRPASLARIFTQEEQAYCESRVRPAAHYAACLVARGAVLKALGCDTESCGGLATQEVSVERDEQGRPQVRLLGEVAEVARKQGVREVVLSLSMTHDIAVANAVAVTDEVVPKAPARYDQKSKLRQSFRRARTVLDELDRLQGQVSALVPQDMSVESGTTAGSAVMMAATPLAVLPESKAPTPAGSADLPATSGESVAPAGLDILITHENAKEE